MGNLPESRGCLLQLTLFFCDWRWLVSGVRRWHTCPTPRRRLVVSCSAVGSAASGGSSVAVGDAAVMGPELPFYTWWHGAHRSLHSSKALDFRSPRPLAFVLSEFVNLMTSWLCGCWGMGGWPALPLLSLRRTGGGSSSPFYLAKDSSLGDHWVIGFYSLLQGSLAWDTCHSVSVWLLENP